MAARPSPTQGQDGQDGQGRRAGGRACVRAAGQRSCHLSARQGHDSQCTAFPQPRKLLTWQLLRNRAVSLSIYYIIYFLLFISFFLHSCCWSSWFRQRGAPCQMVCVCVCVCVCVLQYVCWQSVYVCGCVCVCMCMFVCECGVNVMKCETVPSKGL